MAGAGVAPGELANSVGTAETIAARSPTVPDVGRALELRAAVTVYPGGEHWAALVSAARAGIVLTRAADALGHSLEELDRLSAATTPVGVGDDAVDAIAHGTRPPSEVLPDGSPGDIWAGLLRALVQRTVEGATRLVSLVGDPRRVVTFGGGSVSRPWLQAKAAALPWPLWRAGTISAVARGAALHAGVAAGWWPSADEAPRPVADRID
jgi:xylulokinase